MDGGLPDGFEDSGAAGAGPASYRTPGEPGPTRTLSRRWRSRFGFAGAILLVWGTFVTAFGVACFAIGASDPGALVMTPVIALGGAALYVGIANLVERTRVTITPGEVTRRDGPLRWRSVATWRRHRGDRVVARAVTENDVRNASARWPAPRTHAVVVISREEDRTMRLFEQILSEADARTVAGALSRWMEDTEG